jgi:hypothetical protein
MASKTITSLAILKAEWDERHSDHIETFVPFFVNLFLQKRYKFIELDVLKKDFESEYGLVIPYHPISTILTRLAHRQYLMRGDGQYIPNYKKFESSNFNDVREIQGRKFSKLTEAVIKFSKEIENIQISPEEAEAAILAFFKDIELNLLFASEFSDVVPDLTKKSTAHHHRYLVGLFVRKIRENDQDLFSLMTDIAIGHALADAILYAEQLQKYEGSIKNLNVYLDASLVLSLLGLNDKVSQDSVEELINSLKEQGAILNIFEHTFDEVMGILHSALFWFNKGTLDLHPEKASRAQRFFLLNEFSETDIEMFLTQVPQVLKKWEVQRVAKPEYTQDIQYQIDETELKKLILDEYKKDPYFDEFSKDETINKDIQSVYAITKIRKGKVAFNLRESKGIFITQNRVVARLSSKVQIFPHTPFSIPPCLTDVFIGTVIWLQSPIRARSINEKKIMAEAYAAIQPTPAIVRKYLIQIETLKRNGNISDDQYLVLRAHRVSLNLLARKTRGDETNFTPKTPIEILDELNKGRTSKIDKELKRKTKELELTGATLRMREKSEEKKALTIQHTRTILHRLSFLAAKSCVWVLIPGILAGIFFLTIVSFYPDSFSRPIQYASMSGIYVIGVLGFNMFTLKMWIEEFVYKKVLDFLYRIFKLNANS